MSEYLFWWSCRLKTWNFIKKRLQHRSFLCIFQNTRWYFVLVVVVDIFWRFCCWWCCHMLFSQSCFSRKLFSHCRLPFFEMFVYVLLKFDWLIIFFLENPTRKLKIINFFFSHFQHSFSNFTIAHAQF